MIRHGIAPFLECSSRGDTRFSAFHARVHCGGFATIEELYQARKKFRVGNEIIQGLQWYEAKGRKPLNAEECVIYYSMLWDAYIEENQYLLPVLLEASGLSDMFGQPGHVCQATELWRIRNKHKEKTNGQ